MKLLTLLFSILLFLVVISHSLAAQILVVAVAPMRSHSMMHEPIVRELLLRGHAVTFITNFPMEKGLGSNYTEILINPPCDPFSTVCAHFEIESYLETTKFSLRDTCTCMNIIAEVTTEYALQQPKIQEIFNRTDTKNVYDLLILQHFTNDAFLALGVKYNIPVVVHSVMGFEAYMSQMFGLIMPWSFVPNGLLNFDDRMSFWERLVNTLAGIFVDMDRLLTYFPLQDKLVKKYLSHLPIKIPPVSQMEKDISLILLNAHAPLTSSRPMVPAMIPVGGMHIYPSKPLPEDIQKFIDGASHGVIYFSLGSSLPITNMDAEKLQVFLDVFRAMKQRVLWKFGKDIPNLPANMMIKSWMPQNDILAHPNVKVFITHGGLFGSQEGIYYGVPMIGMPFFFDQFHNVRKIVSSGYGLELQFPSVTRESLKHALTELLENPSYRKNVQKAKEIFRDRPRSPRETAVYWIEYVIRHKGARHMRSAGLDLAWYEFYLLDVVGVALLVVVVVVLAVTYIIRALRGNKIVKVKES